MGNNTTTYTYSYQIRDNISRISDGTNATSFTYNVHDVLTRENNQAAGKTWTYTYDGSGNILTKKEYAYTTGALGTPLDTITYTYGDSTWGDLLTAYNGQTLTYDEIGNLTSDGTWTYTWQHARQLASMTDGTTSLSFAYNADGQRVSKTVGGTTYNYTYANGVLTHMQWGSNYLHFIYDTLGPVAVDYNGDLYYYLRNAQGDIVGIVNGAGTQVVSYTYDAWGKLLTTTGTMASTLGVYNPLRYRGYVYDTETGLYYLTSRYYNPSWGRFINADTAYISTGQGIVGSNMFAYCNNNPVVYVDFFGTLPSIWSFESDWAGRDILWRWLYGDGTPYIISDGSWGDYMRANSLLNGQIKTIIYSYAAPMQNGTAIEIDFRTNVEIENGESIIGYQYLHGTNDTVGGFQVKGSIEKDYIGNVKYDIMCTWNDMIDPNKKYASDQIKAQLAKLIPFSKCRDYYISITWSVSGLYRTGSGARRIGQMVSCVQ